MGASIHARTGRLWKLGFAVGSALVILNSSSLLSWAQLPGYPAPRYPDYRKALHASVDELMPVARLMARKVSRRMALEPGYEIKPGENVLIVVSSLFDQRVLSAIERAIVELGGRVDVIRTHAEGQGGLTGNFGFEEIRMMTLLSQAQQARAAPQPQPSRSNIGGESAIKALVEAVKAQGGPGYDLVINGSGGPNPKADYRWEYIPWDTPDKFMYSMAAFPYELQNMIDERMWNTMTTSAKIHATDPEGTDMTWNWSPNFVGMLREHWPGYPMVKAGHLSAMPLFQSPAEADANGTIAGTTNHTGSFPHLKLTIQKNEIIKVEGGDEYGKRWQAVLEDCKKKGIHFPGFPAPGCGWFEEAAIGTDVWRARSLTADIQRGAQSWERGRSGVIHWGLGVSQNLGYHPALMDWYRQNSGQTLGGGGHRHIHTLFTTMDYIDANGKATRAMDKGRVTFMDDPEVRRAAQKYGNPDELLKEKWIPPFPGITVAGDYMKDYGSDPYKYNHPYMEKIRQEAGWAEYMKRTGGAGAAGGGD